MTDAVKKSTILEQYRELKKKHPESLLLFRCGDFYETYDADASVASAILGITLTKNAKNNINMAGFPYHALDTYLPKLIRAGKRVAICDQIEECQEIPPVKSGKVKTNNKPSKSEEEMTKEQENAIRSEYENKIEAMQKVAEDNLMNIATATVKALGSNIPPQLNNYLATAIGGLELIKIKHRNNVKPFAEEMNYLITMAQKALNAETATTETKTGIHR